MAYAYEFPRPAVAVDVILLRQREETEVLLVERGNEPFRGLWAIPGGFVEIEEDLPDAARRELREETGIHIAENERLVELGTFGKPGRDPRGRVISVVYLAGVACSESAAAAGDDAARAQWFPLSRPPELAFDHAEVLGHARRRLAEDPGLTADLAPDA
jgi:8-oxo-dGTP diphosphatase